MTTENPPPSTDKIIVREALRLLWEADSYPHLGNGDIPVAALLQEEALAKAASAVSSPDDPPEFSIWLATLQDEAVSCDTRESAMTALYDLFDPER